MDVNSRSYAYMTYLSLALGIPSSPLPLDIGLKSHDARLRDIEHRLGEDSPTGTGSLRHRATFAYGHYTGRCSDLTKITVEMVSPGIQYSSTPPVLRSESEKLGFRVAIWDLIRTTQSKGFRLPDNMPAFITWTYVRVWEKALKDSPSLSPTMELFALDSPIDSDLGQMDEDLTSSVSEHTDVERSLSGWPVPPPAVSHASQEHSPVTEFADIDGALLAPEDANMGLVQGIGWK